MYGIQNTNKSKLYIQTTIAGFFIFNLIVLFRPSIVSEASYIVLFVVIWISMLVFGMVFVGVVSCIRKPTHDQKLGKLFDHYTILLGILLIGSVGRFFLFLALVLNKDDDGFVIFRIIYSFIALVVYIGLAWITIIHHGYTKHKDNEDKEDSGSGEASPPSGNH